MAACFTELQEKLPSKLDKTAGIQERKQKYSPRHCLKKENWVTTSSYYDRMWSYGLVCVTSSRKWVIGQNINKLSHWTIKQLLKSVFAKCCDLSVSRRSIIYLSLRLWQIIDLRATDKSQYFGQPRPLIVNYFIWNVKCFVLWKLLLSFQCSSIPSCLMWWVLFSYVVVYTCW